MKIIYCDVCKERPANYGAQSVSSYLDADSGERFEVIKSERYYCPECWPHGNETELQEKGCIEIPSESEA